MTRAAIARTILDGLRRKPGRRWRVLSLAAGYMTLVFIIVWLFLCPDSEWLIRFRPEDVKIIDGDDLPLLQTEGPPVLRKDYSVFELKKDSIYSFALGDAEGLMEITLNVGDVNTEGIPGILYCGEETDGVPGRIAKGWTSFPLNRRERGMQFALNRREGRTELPMNCREGRMQLTLIPEENTVIRLNRIAMIRDSAKRIFPWNLFLVLSGIYWFIAIYDLKNEKACPGNVPGKKRTAVMLSAWFLFYMMQMRNTFYSFDDFGYLSLTYQNLTDNIGPAPGIPDIFRFLRMHYLKWGGRVTAFFIEIIVGRSLTVLRIFSSAVLTGISYEVMRLLQRNKEGNEILPHLFVLSPLLFCFLDLTVLRDSAYWYTAAALYLWPGYCVFVVMRLYMENRDRDGHFSAKVLSLIVIFLAASSQEQVSAGFFVMVVGISERRLSRKSGGVTGGKYRFSAWLVLSVGSALLFAAPGNYARLQQAGDTGMLKPPAGRMVENGGRLLRMLGGDETRFFMLLFVTAAAVAFWFPARRRRKVRAFFLIGALYMIIAAAMLMGGCGFTSVFYIFMGKIHAEYLNDFGDLCLGAVLAAGFFAIFREMDFLRDRRMAVLIAGAAAGLFCAIPAPEVSARMLLPSALFMLPVMGAVLAGAARDAIRHGGRLRLMVSMCFIGFLLAAGGVNQDRIQEGYFRNSEAEETNMRILADYENRKDGNGLVTLQKHWDDTYGNMMPYMQGYEWIMEDMKHFYQLPEDSVIRWE